MALTKPRAYQIYDIDYKQATRVITVVNITLSGGAPSQVDGVNLSLNDRVLVTGQTNKSQNGIYYVTTVGSGANGTWARSTDTNATGELLAGTIVMVTEGLIYADTQWKLVTDDPIVIGTSELIFEQNSAFAFGNVYANGTAVLASSVGDVLTLTAGDNISIIGNNTSKTVTIGVTGISLNSISNGTSNVNVVSSGGNVTVGIAGTSNVAVFSSTGANITGTLGVSGNINGENLITAGLTSTATLSASGNANVGNLGTAGQVTAVGNITGANINGNGRALTSLNATNIDTGTLSQARLANTSITLGNTALTLGATVTTVTGLSSVTSTTFVGALTGAATTAGTVTTAAQPNITSVGTLTSLSVTGNTTSGNLNSSALISGTTITASGNLVGGNANITSAVNAATISTSGNATIGGNLIVQGNITYINIDDLQIEDPVIILGTGPNGTPLTVNDNKDRGVFMEYYTTGIGNAFVGWDNSSGNMIVASDVGLTNDVVTVETYGTLQAGNLYVQSVVSTGNITGGNILGNGAGLTGINAFSNVTVTGGNSAVADSIADTLTLTAGDGIAITIDSSTDTITIAASGGSEIFVDGADFGTVTEAVTLSDDLGLVTEAVEAEADLGTIVTSGIIYPDQLVLPSYTTTTLPSASAPGAMIFVTNETGGAVPAFADGTNWRRVTDRAIVS